MPTKIKSNNRAKYEPSSSANFLGGKLGGLAAKGIGLLGGAARANPLGAAVTVGQGLVGGFKEMLGDRKAALAAGEKYKFGEGLKDFGAGALKGVTGIDLTDQDPTVQEAVQPDMNAQETAMRLQRLESMQAAPTLMYGAPFLMNKPGSPMAKFGIGTNFKLKK